jgi:hypothetical protein
MTTRWTRLTESGDGAPKSSNIVIKLFFVINQSDGI